MQLLAEEETVNYVINELSKDFKLKSEIKVTIEPGYKLNQELFTDALKKSITALKTRIGTNVTKKDYQIFDNRLYLIAFTEDDGQNLIRFICPFGINIANILSNTLIQTPKNKQWNQKTIHQHLKQLFQDTVDHIVTQELFKFYMPDNHEVPSVPKEILDNIQYAGIKNDDFNLVMTFEIPVNDLYQPLKEAVKKKQKDFDYNQVSLAPLQSIVYNDQKDAVKIVTSLI